MIVDDHPLWRATLRQVIEQADVGTIIAEASDGDEAIRLAAKGRPDVVVMDLNLPTIEGADATRELLNANPEVKVLVLSSDYDKPSVLRSVRAGASGYLIKTAESEEIADALRRVHAGELVFPPALASMVLAALRGDESPRESERVKVALAAEAALDREGLTRVLTEAGLDVLASASSTEELMGLIEANPPAVVVIAVGRAPGDVDAWGDAVERIRGSLPNVGLLLLADELEPAHALRLVAGNGRSVGYMLHARVERVEELGEAIRRIARGESVVDPEVVEALVTQRKKKSPIDDLTPREREVLAQMAEGRSNQAICERLFLSPKSVEGYVANIFSKLGLAPAPDDHRRVLAVLMYLRSL
jgi:DNA-binding NarL/FixJ family response regulator